ncbi:MAG: hypothetical protein JXR86_14660 [Spirochaetales bacterium]|nr:hypothetical protein [Spirochaetales bacterium]
MVNRLLVLYAAVLTLSSCAFFGSSVFPSALSMDLSWFIKEGSMRKFYILDNGEDEPLLFLVKEENGFTKTLILDTSLNIRSYLTADPADNSDRPTDAVGPGFVDHAGDFIIGAIRLTKSGTLRDDGLDSVSVPNPESNYAILPYSDGEKDYYLQIYPDYTTQELYFYYFDENWNPLGGNPVPIMPDFMLIPQSDNSLEEIKLATMDGNIYSLTKKSIYDHAAGAVSLNIVDFMPETSVNSGSLTEWVTRCSLGYFVSRDDRNLVLFDYGGNEMEYIENKDSSGEIVTIDYDCEYYYLVDWDENIIRKERAPFRD